MIQLYQKQPSPVKKKKSVKELLHENLRSGESPIKSPREGDSLSPRLGKLTNKLRSESQEALETQMKARRKRGKVPRTSLPKVNFCTPEKKARKSGFRSVFVHAPQPMNSTQQTAAATKTAMYNSNPVSK